MLGKLFSGGEVSPSAQIPLPFKMSAERSLRLSSTIGYDALPVWRYLSHHIRRYPHDLRAHIQRILLAQTGDLNNCLGGSVLDLFLALGDSGDMLKERVLSLCADDMSEDAQALLRNILTEGVEPGHSTFWLQGSMLTTGDSAKPHKLLKLQRGEAQRDYSSLQAEVQDYLEYGQLDLAQELLEKAVLSEQVTPELEQDLLTIYRHTRNKTGLEKFAVELNSGGVELSEHWVSALHESVNW